MTHEQTQDKWLWRIFLFIVAVGLFHTCVGVAAEFGLHL